MPSKEATFFEGSFIPMPLLTHTLRLPTQMESSGWFDEVSSRILTGVKEKSSKKGRDKGSCVCVRAVALFFPAVAGMRWVGEIRNCARTSALIKKIKMKVRAYRLPGYKAKSVL